MCKGVKSAPAIPPLHTDIYFKEMVVPTPVPNYNVNISIMMKKKNCLWSVLCSYFSRTTPEFDWKRTETHFFRESQLAS